MTTNLVLFLACAPLWLLVAIGAAMFAALLPLAPAALRAFAPVRSDAAAGQVNPAPGAYDLRLSNRAALA
jgi:hypothetical protein